MLMRIVPALIFAVLLCAPTDDASAIEFLFERQYRDCAPPGEPIAVYRRGIVGKRYDIETAPALYTWHRRRVMVRPPYRTWSRQRAVYRRDRRRRVLVRPARRVSTYHPAKYRWVEQRVLRRPIKYRAIRYAGRPGWVKKRIYVRGRRNYRGRC